jgi:hypothetical protein
LYFELSLLLFLEFPHILADPCRIPFVFVTAITPRKSAQELWRH